MSKVAISISMDSDLAQELKLEAERTNEKSFSALVCRLIVAGRAIRQPLIPAKAAPPDLMAALEDSLAEIRVEQEDSPTNRVRAEVSSARRSVTEVAGLADVSEAETADILYGFAENGEIMIRIIAGTLYCWADSPK